MEDALGEVLGAKEREVSIFGVGPAGARKRSILPTSPALGATVVLANEVDK